MGSLSVNSSFSSMATDVKRRVLIPPIRQSLKLNSTCRVAPLPNGYLGKVFLPSGVTLEGILPERWTSGAKNTQFFLLPKKENPITLLTMNMQVNRSLTVQNKDLYFLPVIKVSSMEVFNGWSGKNGRSGIPMRVTEGQKYLPIGKPHSDGTLRFGLTNHYFSLEDPSGVKVIEFQRDTLNGGVVTVVVHENYQFLAEKELQAPVSNNKQAYPISSFPPPASTLLLRRTEWKTTRSTLLISPAPTTQSEEDQTVIQAGKTESNEILFTRPLSPERLDGGQYQLNEGIPLWWTLPREIGTLFEKGKDQFFVIPKEGGKGKEEIPREELFRPIALDEKTGLIVVRNSSQLVRIHEEGPNQMLTNTPFFDRGRLLRHGGLRIFVPRRGDNNTAEQSLIGSLLETLHLSTVAIRRLMPPFQIVFDSNSSLGKPFVSLHTPLAAVRSPHLLQLYIEREGEAMYTIRREINLEDTRIAKHHLPLTDSPATVWAVNESNGGDKIPLIVLSNRVEDRKPVLQCTLSDEFFTAANKSDLLAHQPTNPSQGALN